MPQFSKRSMGNLKTCDTQLVKLFTEVVKTFDCIVLEGHRSAERQHELFLEGRTTLDWYEGPDGEMTSDSKHASKPSRAADVVPYPIDWEDRPRFYLFAGFVLGVASHQNIALTWGGDWNGNFHWKDQRFHDLPHFQLKS